MVKNGDFVSLHRKKPCHVLDEQEVSYFHPLHTCQPDSKIHFDPNSICCYVMILTAGVV